MPPLFLSNSSFLMLARQQQHDEKGVREGYMLIWSESGILCTTAGG